MVVRIWISPAGRKPAEHFTLMSAKTCSSLARAGVAPWIGLALGGGVTEVITDCALATRGSVDGLPAFPGLSLREAGREGAEIVPKSMVDIVATL